jgi:hypothetical protein
VVEQFERADLLAADEGRKLGRGLVVQLAHGISSRGGAAILASLSCRSLCGLRRWRQPSTTPLTNPRHCFARMIPER